MSGSKEDNEVGQRNPVWTNRQIGRLGLSWANAHHGKLTVLINERCRGLSTKYLSTYLDWHRAMCRAGFKGKTLLVQAPA